MHDISFPSIQNASVLFEQISFRLWESFDCILNASRKSDSRFAGLIDHYRSRAKAPPFFFAAHELLVSSYVRGQPIDQCLCDLLLEFDEYSFFENLEILPFLRSAGLQEKICHAVICSDVRRTYKDAIKNDLIPRPFKNDVGFDVSKRMMAEALSLIRLADEALFKETQFVVNEVRIFQSGNLRAGTTFNTLGMIYVGVFASCDDLSRYIEHVVHESAHNLLYAHWMQDPLFENHNDRLYPTPFRKDNRPLSAVYHAAFVLARTIYVFDRLYALNSCALDFSRIRTGYNERGNDAPFKEKFLQTIQVILNNAILTDYGRSIIDSCQEMVEGCALDI